MNSCTSLRVLSLIAAVVLASEAAVAQPSLFPPGPPGVSGRFGTRTEINMIPYTITAPGSYYLSQTLFQTIAGTSGITIASSNVTIDLNGHALIGGPFGPGDSGIVWAPGPAFQDVTISNGTIAFWSGNGINLGPIAGANQMVHLFDLVVYSSAGGDGIIVPPESIVRQVISTYNTGSGVSTGRGCKLTNVISSGNGAAGILTNLSHVSDSIVDFNGADGMFLGSSSVVIGSVATENDLNGIVTGPSCRVTDCAASFNGFAFGFGNGFFCAGPGSILGGCSAYNNANDGFSAPPFAPPDGNSVHDCYAQSNGFVSGIGNGFTNFRSVMQCTASGNFVNGIELFEDGHVHRCTSEGNFVSGIVAIADGSVIENNHVADNGFAGIDTTLNGTGFGNFVAGNRAHANLGGPFLTIAGVDTIAPIFVGPGIMPIGGSHMNVTFP